MPFALVHGESLIAAASWAVGEAGIQLYDATVTLAGIRASGRMLVLHDPLCPLTPPEFLAEAVRRCAETDQVVVGYRPVTDTVKPLLGDVLGRTVDRSALLAVATPVVIPARVLAEVPDADAGDFAALVERLAAYGPICWIEAPALARRVLDPAELGVLEALSRSSV